MKFRRKPVRLPAQPFLVIGHRGASTYAPEHTMISYDMAAQMGANYIEIDLHRTKDGKLVSIHDEVIPYAGNQTSISDLTLDELKQFSPGHQFNKTHLDFASQEYETEQIPELNDILTHFDNNANFYIELKSPKRYPGIEEELLEILRTHSLIGQHEPIPSVIIQSFDADCLKRIFDMEPSIPLIQLYSFKGSDATLSGKEIRKLKKYASGVGVNYKSLTQTFIAHVQQAGLHVHPYTVNEETALLAVMEMGVNGVFTDRPDMAVRISNEFFGLDKHTFT